MHIAIGYAWFPTAAAFHLERAFLEEGHRVTYLGLPCAGKPGYDSRVPVNEVLAALPEPPDLYLWVDPAAPYFPPGIELAEVPTACYLIDVHLGSWRRQVARFFDAVFVAQRDHVPTFRAAVGHGQVYWLPLAAATDVHRDQDLPRTFDVGFVGNTARAHRGTPRARRLSLLAARFHTNDFRAAYSPQQVGEVYSRSRIVFNTSIAGDVTMRVFEGTACGALVLTDSVANGLDELFNIGSEIVTYDGDEDLIDKVSHYLAYEDERDAIAKAGRRRTLAEHTYGHRVRSLLAAVTARGFARIAPMRAASAAERRHARREVLTHLHMVDAILDDARQASEGPLSRALAVLPALARRLVM